MLRTLGRWAGFSLLGLVVLAVVVLVVAWISTKGFATFGGTPDPQKLRRSPAFVNGHFQNREPTSLMALSKWPGALKEWFFGKQMRTPVCALPLAPTPPFAWPASRPRACA